MSKELNSILKKYLEGLKTIFGKHLKKAILYGSYARGDNNKNSDIDIMILVDISNEEIKEKMREVAELSFEFDMKYDIVISPIINNITHFEQWINIVPFYKNVGNEGVVISEENQ